jgi:hypothetical protein
VVVVSAYTSNVTDVNEFESSVLSELLDEELGSDPTTSRHLTNHLPMALVAKSHLGASDDELRRFATAYSRRNVPLAPLQHELSHSSWTTAIGQRGASGDLRDYFTRCILDNGIDDTMKAHLPALLPGISGAAFHGAIRLAYALEVQSADRVAAGLGYLAEVATPLGPLVATGVRSDEPLELIAELSETFRWSDDAEDGNIDDRMHAVAQHAEFQSLALSLDINDGTLQKLADAALQIYAATNDFTALHGVTGIAAISSLREWCDDPGQVDLFSFQALAAAYQTIGCPPLWTQNRLDELVAQRAVPQEAVEHVGANSNDEHVSKLIYTSLRYFNDTQEPLYLAVATRQAALLTSYGNS